MSDQSINFEEHRRRREEEPNIVRCARCGKWIPMTSTRCPQCGVHFQGQAFEFTHASERGSGRAVAWWFVAIVVAVIVVMVMVQVL